MYLCGSDFLNMSVYNVWSLFAVSNVIDSPGDTVMEDVIMRVHQIY